MGNHYAVLSVDRVVHIGSWTTVGTQVIWATVYKIAILDLTHTTFDVFA